MTGAATTTVDLADTVEAVLTTPEEDPDAAYNHRGHQAAVFRPRFGRAHQQYFTPRWLCEAAYAITAHAFNLEDCDRKLNAIDPTCGSGRLLVPFKQAGHHVLGIELDDRLTTTARRALGKENVHQGDVMVYGPVIPRGAWNVAVINPPYGLWWPVEESGPYEDYELASGRHVESQHMVLELVTKLLSRWSGLLIGVLSGKLFENSARAVAFLGKHYQTVANVTLPHPFREEYGIDVDAAFVVAVRESTYKDKKPVPLTGVFEGSPEELVSAVSAAFDAVRKSDYYPHRDRVTYLAPGYNTAPPEVPRLSMALEVDTESAPLQLTARGVSAGSDWSTGWLKFFSQIPLQAYDAAQGSYTPLGEAYASLPNILIGGVERSRKQLASLGFAVTLSEHDAGQIARRAERYERDRLPVRELEPLEYLAYYPDGPITAEAPATLPDGTAIPAGATYDLRVRWYRDDQIVESEDRGEGRKSYTRHTHIDRGYLVLRFRPLTEGHEGIKLAPFDVREIEAEAVRAMVQAFGLPDVETVDDLPDVAAWQNRLIRFMDAHEKAAGGRRLYPVQALDVVRMATKRNVALLYEMGGGKTATIAHWATLRSYRSVVIVTPAQVAPGIIEDLEKWGFRARRLTHGLVSRLKAGKRRHKLARQRVKQARARAQSLRQRIAELEGLDGDLPARAREWGLGEEHPAPVQVKQVARERRAWLEQQLEGERRILQIEERRIEQEAKLARKRRHLRNLKAIQRKGKARDNAGIAAEIAATEQAVAELAEAVAQTHAALNDHYTPIEAMATPDFYVASYEDLSLGDHLGIFDPWEHEHYSREGEYQGTVRNIRGARCDCGSPRKKAVPACPQCGKRWRGENAGGGRVCRHCGHVAWTMGQTPRRVLPEPEPGSSSLAREVRRERVEILRELRFADLEEDDLTGKAAALPIWAMRRREYQESRAQRAGGVPILNAQDGRDHEEAVKKAVAAGRPVPDRVLMDYPRLARQAQEAPDPEDVFLSTPRMWPLGNRIQSLFPCVVLDEAQDAKSKLSLRGAASRGLRARGKAILTGTWVKGYCIDLFWSAGWLLGFGSPLWPFPYRGGSGRFLEQFGTYQYYTREYADTLEVGRRKLIPSVSNLGRLWKLLSPVSVRRLKEDFLENLPPKHRHVHWLEPEGTHGRLATRVEQEMTGIIQQEMVKSEPSMGRISMALWWGRYVASCPNKYGALHYAGAWGHKIDLSEATPAERRAVLAEMQRAGALVQPAYSFNKARKVLALVGEIQETGEKVIVFTSLRGLYRTLEQAFKDKCIPYIGMDGVPTKKRNARIRQFEASDATVLLAGTGTLNRGVTVNGANHVIILNLEWSPETTLQAEDRCHRPGQKREVHVHYLLCAGTVDEQMWELIEQKWAAQRAVQDREAQNHSVEQILAEAAMANAQLAVARAVIERGFQRKGVSVESAQEQAQEAVEEMASRLAFGAAPAQKKRKRRRKSQVAVRYVGDLFDSAAGDGGNGEGGEKDDAGRPAEEPVQLAMFPM